MDVSTKKILVVEDDDLLRNIIVNQLSTQYQVLSAADGEGGWNEAQSKKPDLVILDLLMPNLDGFGFLKRLRNFADPNLAKIPVIVVSNLSDPQSIDRAKQLNILEYYVKSDVQLGTLQHRIERYFSLNK
jgi:CheY-like chemotaxis protein